MKAVHTCRSFAKLAHSFFKDLGQFCNNYLSKYFFFSFLFKSILAFLYKKDDPRFCKKEATVLNKQKRSRVFRPLFASLLALFGFVLLACHFLCLQ